ncbi:MAG: transglutaminase family protein [SAR324 cluster bacterium]|nr:transglutaminase family protein [SAR324 cluster bacterium]
MSIRVALRHETSYSYDRLVKLSPQVIRLRPAPHCRTPVTAYSLKIDPKPEFINWQQDPFGNFLARITFEEKQTAWRVVVDLVTEMTVINPFDFFLEDSVEQYPFHYAPNVAKELSPYLEIQEDGPLIKEFLSTIKVEKGRTIDFLVAVNMKLHQAIRYVIRLEPGIQSCEETLGLRSGSCRDSAWLMVQVLRHFGLAARFTSGYLIQLTPDVKSLDGPSGTDHDFTDLHAWTEVYLPGAGWVGLDPTSGLFAGEGHLPLASTPHPVDAAPITGLVDECESDIHFEMHVDRIHEDPRVTKPYTDEQWTDILNLGWSVDQKLEADDVRLTMGGEPTFVSIDDQDGPEWNYTALSEKKFQLANNLLQRLKQRFAPKSLLFYGQGKWYPGEILPRWSLGCYWRKDGVPVWQNEKLIAQTPVSDKTAMEIKAREFMEKLAENLGVSTEFILPGYEDAFYYLWKEGTLPVNFDPLQKQLEDKVERSRLVKLLEKGLGSLTGYVLPLAEDHSGERFSWKSRSWVFRRDRMYLIPGDSVMGFRLPLNSLVWEAADQRHQIYEQDTMHPRKPLPDLEKFRQQIEERHESPQPQQDMSLNPSVLRTAICIEPRNGILYVFLPPVYALESWLDLISTLEKTAGELNTPIRLEGYPPPKDWRLGSFQITPDPGVIEVNIHPSSHWEELVWNTEILYEEARLSRLATEKFMLDGRHTGTGGGNHVTIGGSTPADSPFLRRPNLLKSLVNFWQNHPGLSYLFSGLFIGPTSQAPRVDEARDGALYELEIAFQQLAGFTNPSPWIVDRVLRNMLVDLTGNGHRAEFSIDKLYSPDSLSGRQGLVELRAFEMPPHSRMSVVQLLLIRALVSAFWKQPYSQALVPWNTELHDRFMLPHFVRQDLLDVLKYLELSGFSFDPEWFAPFMEFRFPHYGTINADDIKLELRMALEPWNVLGEEMVTGLTSRFVDASVERLQVEITGLTPTRHLVLCNGRRIPLTNTGTQGHYVAGVRYQAWKAPSSLHPTIPVHNPLVFDIYDKWNQRSIAGCTYHVSHPGGLSYETRPVNAYEAETRRISRFIPFGHTPGNIPCPPEETNPWYPYTLDLRKQPV